MSPSALLARAVPIVSLFIAPGCAHTPQMQPHPASAAPGLPVFRSEKAISRALHKGLIPKTTLNLSELAGVRVSRDVRYNGLSERNVLDVYCGTETPLPMPVIIFIHGGAWDHGDKQSCAPYAVRFARSGYVCISANYRLSPTAPFPAALDDVRAVVQWARDHAQDFGGDAGCIALVGQSAGAHLAMLAAYDRHADAPTVRCIVDFYGPADLTASYARRMKAVRRFLGAPYRDAPATYRAASPQYYVSAGDPPTLILHGDIDKQVPVRQADALASVLEYAGVPNTFARVHGWGHAMDRAAPVFEHCVDAMRQFFDQYLR